MHLIQILLPLYDNHGRPFDRETFARIREELTQRFGGLTAYSRAPAEGRWKPAEQRMDLDQIIVYEVMVPAVDAAWWSEYRRRLEQELRQEQVIVRATPIEVL